MRFTRLARMLVGELLGRNSMARMLAGELFGRNRMAWRLAEGVLAKNRPAPPCNLPPQPVSRLLCS